MYCIKCGQKIPDNAAFCPECGEKQNVAVISPPVSFNEANRFSQPPAEKSNRYNTLSIVGLVISGVSFIYSLWGFTAILGVVLSIIGRNQCKKSMESGETLADLGIALGVFSIFALYFLAGIIVAITK